MVCVQYVSSAKMRAVKRKAPVERGHAVEETRDDEIEKEEEDFVSEVVVCCVSSCQAIIEMAVSVVVCRKSMVL